MSGSTSSNSLHITIGTGVQSVPRQSFEKLIDLSHELRLLKCALLYADEVKLCSMATSFLFALLPFAQMNELEQLEAAKGILVGHGMPYDKAKALITTYQEIQRKTDRSPQEEAFYLRFKSSIEEAASSTKRGIEDLFVNAGGEELSVALNSGLVDLHLLRPFDTDSQSVVQEYFDLVSEAMISGRTYPLLDDVTGDLVSKSVQEGKIHFLGTSAGRAKQVGLSAGLINRLPLFDAAPMDHVLDIRKELNKPLIRFRAAIMDFSKELESLPWEREFSQEVETIFLSRVEPAILDIEEAVKTNKSLLNLVATPLTYGVSGGSVIGIALSQITHLDSLLTLSIAASVTAGAYKVVKERREWKEEIEKQQLYFYYMAGRLIGS